jgi:hypothetical protein
LAGCFKIPPCGFYFVLHLVSETLNLRRALIVWFESLLGVGFASVVSLDLPQFVNSIVLLFARTRLNKPTGLGNLQNCKLVDGLPISPFLIIRKQKKKIYLLGAKI